MLRFLWRCLFGFPEPVSCAGTCSWMALRTVYDRDSFDDITKITYVMQCSTCGKLRRECVEGWDLTEVGP